MEWKGFVQGSRLGKHLYESHGFVDKEGWIMVPVAEKHKNRPAIWWFNLERPAKASTIPEAKMQTCDNWARGVELYLHLHFTLFYS